MKKIALLFLMALIMGSSASAQNYDQGDMNLSAGIGFGSVLSGDLVLPPTSLSFEYGLMEDIGVGVYFGYATAEEVLNFYSGEQYRWDYTYTLIGLRGAYHFWSTDNIDVYGGAMLGWNVATAEYSSDDIDESLVDDVDVGGFAFSLYAGGRYYVNDMFGFYGELGYGISFFNLGLTLKL